MSPAGTILVHFIRQPLILLQNNSSPYLATCGYILSFPTKPLQVVGATENYVLIMEIEISRDMIGLGKNVFVICLPRCELLIVLIAATLRILHSFT